MHRVLMEETGRRVANAVGDSGCQCEVARGKIEPSRPGGSNRWHGRVAPLSGRHLTKLSDCAVAQPNRSLGGARR